MTLTPDEIRTAMMIVSHYQTAQARVQMAREMEAEFMAQLRAKYELDDSWVCNDLLTGFEQVAEGSQHDES